MLFPIANVRQYKLRYFDARENERLTSGFCITEPIDNAPVRDVRTAVHASNLVCFGTQI
jgi:hypothetical protein